METVFITIHDLSLDARIRYCSDSVEDVLGYLPREVVNKSCWEYFHPDEIPFARAVHGRGIRLDKASVLNYCQIKHKDGHWVGCECVFTVVYDVLVSCTSIYKQGPKSENRAFEAPVVRRLFSSSPRDPRYHMLSYISNKFLQTPQHHLHEPRAALFLNRFTRTSTIMFATNGVSTILGLTPEQLIGKSFYFCIAETCLQDAIRCLESAKANDSIAYLRFWFRNPQPEDGEHRDVQMTDGRGSDEDEDEDEGGVRLGGNRGDGSRARRETDSSNTTAEPVPSDVSTSNTSGSNPQGNSRSSSGNSTDLDGNSRDQVFDGPVTAQSSSSSVSAAQTAASTTPIEIEAVVSCSSDGLVVILRKARPIVPQALEPPPPPNYSQALFASPWALDPMLPAGQDRARWASEAYAQETSRAAPSMSSGPDTGDFMNTIRDVAVFAWSLTGINGSLAQYGQGTPVGESQPPGGLPIWDPYANVGPENDRFNGFGDNTHRRLPETSLPEPRHRDEQSTSSSGSGDEVVFRRAEQMPPWRPVRRRGRQARSDGNEEADEERTPKQRRGL